MILGYIGPGAGITFVGAFLTVLGVALSAFVAMLTWPVRALYRWVRYRKAYAHAKAHRVVIVGLDGLEPDLAERYMQEGLMPNLAKLREQGAYTRLGTTTPPLSPVAWSSFATGANPGKHGIFDFVTRDPASYQMRLSSVRSDGKSLRRSKPFWSVLGEAGIFSAVLRVPITYPPDRFYGVQLSGMCVPDLHGTQGASCLFAESPAKSAEPDDEGAVGQIKVQRQGDTIRGELPGPGAALPFHIVRRRGRIRLHINRRRIELREGELSDWVELRFHVGGLVRARGLCRFYLDRFAPDFRMYATAVHIDPSAPAVPISHPRSFAPYLARRIGPYATLGLAEDTTALKRGLIPDKIFLQQAYDIHAERKRMLDDMLKRVRRGLVVCVFDGPDRIQHMFFRHGHDEEPNATIRDMYVEMDATVGRVMKQLDRRTALFVMSDHGFKRFDRCVDLNAWLRNNGYLVLKDAGDVDWQQTRAYALGFAGIFINRRGREAHGIVDDGDADALIAELCDRLTGLRDNGRVAVNRAIARETTYRGPYVDQAPDVIVGYNVGHRISWTSALGRCGAEVFSDNTSAWSGDHEFDAPLVPGVLFSNLDLKLDDAHIMDIAPTVVDLFGQPVPPYMDGRSLLCEDERSTS